MEHSISGMGDGIRSADFVRLPGLPTASYFTENNQSTRREG